VKQLDLKKEVVLTMLSQLEKTQNGKFVKLEQSLPKMAGIRFHKRTPQELAAQNEIVGHIMEIAKEHQGVWRFSLAELGRRLQTPPFLIPKYLYNLQL